MSRMVMHKREMRCLVVFALLALQTHLVLGMNSLSNYGQLPPKLPTDSEVEPPGIVPGEFPKLPDRPIMREVDPGAGEAVLSVPAAQADGDAGGVPAVPGGLPGATAQSLPDIDAKEFPAEPPRPPPSDDPPPLSPSGRWLHSATFIAGKMFVFGGVGSYSTALYNDMWLYNFAERGWSQLQSSYVPPFPVEDKMKPDVKSPEGPIQMFRPDDAPPAPPLREEPVKKPVLVPVEPAMGANPNVDPVLTASSQKPLEVVKYESPPYRDDKPPGFSFLEEFAVLENGQRRTTFMDQANSKHYSFFKHARSRATSQNVVEGHRMRLNRMGLRKRNRVQSQRSSSSLLEVASDMAAQTRDDPNAAAEPSRYWKNDALSPKLMSPFIAADLWKYDLDTKIWSNIKSSSRDIPAPRWLHTAVTIKGRMVVFGGVSYSDTILGDVWIFNPTDRTWAKANPTGDPILPREGHSAVVMGQTSMFTFGGISYGQIPFNDLWVYDALRNAWFIQKAKGTAPPPRWMHTAAVNSDANGNERMYVFGGVTRNFVPLDDLWYLDKNSLTWVHPASKGYPPFPRMLHTSVVFQDRLMVFGGVANNIPLEDTWVYDLAQNDWHEEFPSGEYPFAREGASLVKIVPPDPTYKPQERTPWLPPEPIPEDKKLTPEALMPTIKNYTSFRPLNRYRKEYNYNRFCIVFGGAGPKPK